MITNLNNDFLQIHGNALFLPANRYIPTQGISLLRISRPETFGICGCRGGRRVNQKDTPTHELGEQLSPVHVRPNCVPGPRLRYRFVPHGKSSPSLSTEGNSYRMNVVIEFLGYRATSLRNPPAEPKESTVETRS